MCVYVCMKIEQMKIIYAYIAVIQLHSNLIRELLYST